MKALSGVLGVVLVLLVGWFVFLRPKSGSSTLTISTSKSPQPAQPTSQGWFGTGITGADVTGLAKTIGGFFSTSSDSSSGEASL